MIGIKDLAKEYHISHSDISKWNIYWGFYDFRRRAIQKGETFNR